MLAGQGGEGTKATLETPLAQMCSFVHFEGVPVLEDIATFIARQRPCACVLPLHVCLKIYLPTGCCHTKLTLPLWFISSVTFSVKNHTALLGESCMADITLIWLLPSVHITLVSFQMSLERSCIRALLTLERLLTRVYPNVLLHAGEFNCRVVTVGIGALVWSLCGMLELCVSHQLPMSCEV